MQNCKFIFEIKFQKKFQKFCLLWENFKLMILYMQNKLIKNFEIQNYFLHITQ